MTRARLARAVLLGAAALIVGVSLAPAAPGDLTLSGPAEGATVDADQVAVGGSAADPSGIVRVTVNGTALPLTATAASRRPSPSSPARTP